MEDKTPYKTNKPAINPKELRIGNLVQYNGLIWYVRGVRSPAPMKDKRFSDKYVIDLFDGAGIISVTIEDVEGIPLNEEILIKAGFRRTDALEYIDDNTGFIFAQSGNYGYELTKGEYSICFTRTVNNLQNLYLALTGCELEIKL